MYHAVLAEQQPPRRPPRGGSHLDAKLEKTSRRPEGAHQLYSTGSRTHHHLSLGGHCVDRSVDKLLGRKVSMSDHVVKYEDGSHISYAVRGCDTDFTVPRRSRQRIKHGYSAGRHLHRRRRAEFAQMRTSVEIDRRGD
jgi:hypothetical protein